MEALYSTAESLLEAMALDLGSYGDRETSVAEQSVKVVVWVWTDSNGHRMSGCSYTPEVCRCSPGRRGRLPQTEIP
jgi:hypothetical protein